MNRRIIALVVLAAPSLPGAGPPGGNTKVSRKNRETGRRYSPETDRGAPVKEQSRLDHGEKANAIIEE